MWYGRKVSSHFQYLENQSHGLDVTRRTVRGDFTVHVWTVTLLWGYSVGSETPLSELMHCVNIALTNLLNFHSYCIFGKSQSCRKPNLGCRRAEDWADALSWWSCHHHLPTAVPICFLLHPSAGEGMWCSIPYLLSGLEECTRGGDLHDQKQPSTWPWCCSDFAVPSSDVKTWVTSIGKSGLLFQNHSHRPTTHLQLWPFWGNLGLC